jgi:alkylhydroperoxidase family enzyme
MVCIRAFLTILLGATACLGRPGPTTAADPPAVPRLPLLDNDEAWDRLPRANPPLPAWARTLAASLPRTTVAMLALDNLHRANNPLGPVLAGQVRWAAADALGCEYAKRCAEADLRRAGWTEKDLKRLAGKLPGLPPAERAALAFTRKLTLAGYSVTDAEVAELLQLFGAEKVVAMVHTVAHCNFQYRIFLALKVEVEPDGPLPPLDVRLDPAKRAKLAAPARVPWEEARKGKAAAESDTRADWDERTTSDLERALERQKERKSRIPLPTPEQLAQVPPESKEQASRVVWTTVSMGYQPVLTKAWFDTGRAFQDEAKLDRVFGNSLFWVVTRSNECFY